MLVDDEWPRVITIHGGRGDLEDEGDIVNFYAYGLPIAVRPTGLHRLRGWEKNEFLGGGGNVLCLPMFIFA